jgi:hypothetical protein
MERRGNEIRSLVLFDHGRLSVIVGGFVWLFSPMGLVIIIVGLFSCVAGYNSDKPKRSEYWPKHLD